MAKTLQDRVDAANRTLAERAKQRPSRRTALPPGPHGAKMMIELMSGRTPAHRVFERVSREFQPMAAARVGADTLFVLSDPDLIRSVFVGQGRFLEKPRGLQLTRGLLGDGLLTSEGDVHKRHRRLVQPAFHRNQLEHYSRTMTSSAADLSARWRTWVDQGRSVVDVPEQMSRLTLTIVADALFGTRVDEDADTFNESLAAVMEWFSQAISMPMPRLMMLGRRGRAVRDAVDRLDEVIARVVADRRTQIAAGKHRADMLGLLLEAEDEDGGPGLSDDEIRDEAMTMILAGHETTAMALTWTWRHLSMNPAAAEWLRVELDAVGDEIGYGQYGQLHRTRAVIAESMRLHPPAWIIGRYATDDVEAQGEVIPKGSIIVASTYAVHRDPRFWSEPGQFRPWRWLDESGQFSESAPGQPRDAWFPFGFGNRKCIGDQFAWLEAVLVLACLARDWHVAVRDPQSVRAEPAVTLRVKGRMPADLQARRR